MNLRQICAAVGVAAFMVATTADATVHRVFPNESIQAAIDAAAPGDTILVEPGTYQFVPPPVEAGKYYYGLRIKTDNLRLIGKGEPGKVRLVYAGPPNRAEDVGAGVYAAPEGCEYWMEDNKPEGEDCKTRKLKRFYIRGFSVEGFPRNGIQTRWVDGFEFVRNASVNNLNNGIYPTLSANGLVQNNVSYGSLDTAMWVAGSENVRVIGNKVFGSVIGFEITVSNNVLFTQNEVYDNTVGIGLFHPNGAGNPPTAVTALNNWVIEHNDVRDNNRPNEATHGFQSLLPAGIGILLVGVSGHTIAKNTVEDNDFVGIGLLGWCTATNGFEGYDCEAKPPVIDGVTYDPGVSNNHVSQNKVGGNGENRPSIPIGFLAADMTYFAVAEVWSSGNCFEKNKPSGFTFFSSEPPFSFATFESGPLPTDGCKKP
jgi:parallel beta-helix repeat protein